MAKKLDINHPRRNEVPPIITPLQQPQGKYLRDKGIQALTNNFANMPTRSICPEFGQNFLELNSQ